MRSSKSKKRRRTRGTGLGEVIRRARLDKGLTLQRVADDAKIHMNSLAGIEAGRDNVRSLTLIGIGRAVGIPAWQLMRAAEEPGGRRGRGADGHGHGQGEGEDGRAVTGDREQVDRLDAAPAAHDPGPEAPALAMNLPDLRLTGVHVLGPTFGDVADLVRGLERPDVRAAQGMPGQRRPWAQILDAPQLRPVVHAALKHEVRVTADESAMKTEFFGASEPYLAFEPRALVGAVVMPGTYTTRALYCLRLRSSVVPRDQQVRMLRRIALYILSGRLPVALRDVEFFRGTVPPPVVTFRRAPFPGKLLTESPVTRRLDHLADRVEAWTRRATTNSRGRPLHVLLAMRDAVPHRSEIEDALRVL